MSTSKNGFFNSNNANNPRTAAPLGDEVPENGEEAPIRINGFDQVLQMLKAADPAFRESLLRRIAGRDPRLAATLRRDLRD